MHTANQKLLEIRSTIDKIAWPPVSHGVAATLTTLLHQLEASQWFAPERLIECQFIQLELIVAHAAQHSPFFRQRLERAHLSVQDILSPEGLRRLPPLLRREIQEAGESLFCQNIPPLHMPVTEGRSSGSTGIPVSIKKTGMNRLMWNANMMREHFWHKRDFSEKVVNVRASATTITHQKSWGNPVDLLFPSAPVLEVPIIFSSRQLADAIMDFGGQHLIIYPNALEALVTLCEKEKLPVTTLRHIWSIGETLKPELRAKAAAIFGASVEDDYSSQEMGILALQCPVSGMYHVMAESVIVEVVDENGKPCKEGEIGKVLITDIHNYATPLIRYDVGDYAQVGGPCPCGRGLPTLASIKGRYRNLLTKPNGNRHWPPIGTHMIRSGLILRHYQIIQHSLDDVEVKLVPGQAWGEAEEKLLTEHLQRALDHPFNMRFTYFEDRIPLPPNGKFESFISHVTA